MTSELFNLRNQQHEEQAADHGVLSHGAEMGDEVVPITGLPNTEQVTGTLD